MPFDFRKSFETNGLSYQDFLGQFGSESDQRRWQSVYEKVQLSAAQQALISNSTRRMNVLVMAGAWCGDCARQCPVIFRISQLNPVINLKLVERDRDAELANELRICSAPRIPQVVMLDEDFNFVARYGERTLNQLRELHGQLTGTACSTGFMSEAQMALQVSDWLAHFEYVQMVLRLSPRLRERYQD